jgi:glycosyltransferase involved in cell wall biosynthesis
LITREFPPSSGGIGYFVYNLSKKLVERGHKVTVITRGNTCKTYKEFVDEIDVYYVTFFPLYPFHLYLHGFFVNSLIKSMETDFDIIHLHSPLVPPITTTLPIVTTVHTAMRVDSRYHEMIDLYSLAEKMQSMYFSPPVESKLLRFSSMITSVSQSVADELKEYGMDPGRVRITGNAVDERLFFPNRSDEKSINYILFTGVLRARKGLFDLIKSAALVNKKMPNTKFVICGTGPLLRKLKEQVGELGLQQQIIFTGRVDREKLIRLYQNATVFVVPSIYEGLPTVLLEAMACGLPVVATNIGGNRDVISSGTNGFLVPKRSPEEMTKKILELMDNEPLRIRIGTEARETVMNKYTWNKVADKFINLYQELT